MTFSVAVSVRTREFEFLAAIGVMLPRGRRRNGKNRVPGYGLDRRPRKGRRFRAPRLPTSDSPTPSNADTHSGR